MGFYRSFASYPPRRAPPNFNIWGRILMSKFKNKETPPSGNKPSAVPRIEHDGAMVTSPILSFTKKQVLSPLNTPQHHGTGRTGVCSAKKKERRPNYNWHHTGWFLRHTTSWHPDHQLAPKIINIPPNSVKSSFCQTVSRQDTHTIHISRNERLLKIRVIIVTRPNLSGSPRVITWFTCDNVIHLVFL